VEVILTKIKGYQFMIKKSLIMAASITLLSTGSFSKPIPDEVKQNGFAVGCQAYSFSRFSLFEAIEKTSEVGAKVIELYPGQKLSKMEPQTKWDHNASTETITKVKDKLKEQGLTPVNYGVVSGKDAAEWRKIFEFARGLELYAITTEDVDKLDIIEPLVKEFDIKVAIHNHPRKMDNPDYRVWDPHYIAEVIKGRDERIGACADTGHWMTSGINPVYGLRVLEGRIISTHLKDKKDYGSSYNVVYGTGKGEIADCLNELARHKFEGNISIEHEHNWMESVPEIEQCVDFVVNHKVNSERSDGETTGTM
jgi:sugar phosphate isomerase/epimerase